MKQQDFDTGEAYIKYLEKAMHLVKAYDDLKEKGNEERVNFAFVFGSDSSKNRLGLDKTMSSMSIAKELRRWMGLKTFIYGTAFFSPKQTDVLYLDLYETPPPGVGKKVHDNLHMFKAPRFANVILLVEGKPHRDDSDAGGHEHEEREKTYDRGGDDAQKESPHKTGGAQLNVVAKELVTRWAGLKSEIERAGSTDPELYEQLQIKKEEFVLAVEHQQLDVAEALLAEVARLVRGEHEMAGSGSAGPAAAWTRIRPASATDQPRYLPSTFTSALAGAKPLLDKAKRLEISTSDMQELKSGYDRAETALKEAARKGDYASAVRALGAAQSAAQKLLRSHHEQMKSKRQGQIGDEVRTIFDTTSGDRLTGQFEGDYNEMSRSVSAASPPPWDPVTEALMRSDCAKLLMLQERWLGGESSAWQAAADPANSGESESYWVLRRTWAGRKKAFFFKPLDGEDKKYGIPKGGMGAREIVAGSVADRIASVTGIEFGMPAAHPAVMPQRYLAPGSGGGRSGDPDRLRVGSMQDYVESQGLLKAQSANLLNSIPKTETQKMALFDLITLNTDRNSANCMVGGPHGGPPTLIPIDQGLCLPTRKAFTSRTNAMAGAIGNALLNLPGADEKLGDDLQAALTLLSPNDIVDAVRAGCDTISKTLGQDGDSLIDEESIRLSAQSLAFVKRAAPHLTVREMFNALAVDGELIFDTKEDKAEAAFDEAIAAARERVKAEAELAAEFSTPEAPMAELKALGWCHGLAGATLFNARRRECASWLKIIKGRVQNPMLPTLIKEALDELAKLDVLDGAERLKADIKGRTPEEAGERIISAQRTASSKAAAQAVNFQDARAETLAFDEAGGQALAAKVVESFPDLALMERGYLVYAMQQWSKYQALGGDDAFYALGGSSDDGSIDARMTYIRDRRAHKEALALVGEKTLDERIKARVLSNLESIPARLRSVKDGVAAGELRAQLSAIHSIMDNDTLSEEERYKKAALPLNKLIKALEQAGV